MLTVFFVKNKNDKVLNIPLVVYANDVVLKVGEKTDKFFTVSNIEADISFDYQNSGIISIENNTISALSPGNCLVKVEANYNGEVAFDQFFVKVEGSNYSFEITNLFGGIFKNNTLILENNICQFKINIFDKENVKIENALFNYEIVSGNGVLNYEMGQLMLSTNEDCILKFYYPDYDFTFEINVKVIV